MRRGGRPLQRRRRIKPLTRRRRHLFLLLQHGACTTDVGFR